MNISTFSMGLLLTNIIWFVCSCIQNKGWHDTCEEMNEMWFLKVRELAQDFNDLKKAVDDLETRLTFLEITMPIDVEEI